MPLALAFIQAESAGPVADSPLRQDRPTLRPNVRCPMGLIYATGSVLAAIFLIYLLYRLCESVEVE
jgi:hypothetical protein